MVTTRIPATPELKSLIYAEYVSSLPVEMNNVKNGFLREDCFELAMRNRDNAYNPHPTNSMKKLTVMSNGTGSITTRDYNNKIITKLPEIFLHMTFTTGTSYMKYDVEIQRQQRND